MGRHAYLIMAHNRPDILKELLSALDDSRNDIYLHIDKKSNADMDFADFKVSEATLTPVPAINVKWGGYSQIECTLNMLEVALKDREHDYYHLMTGVSYPLKSQEYIHDFFDKNKGKEFIDIVKKSYDERVKYIWLFNERGKIKNRKSLLRFIRWRVLKLQKLIGVDRFKKFNMECKKGLAYWSITHKLAIHILNQRELIYDIFKYSLCGDEVFVQTFAYNSPFRDKIFDGEGVLNGCKRISTWRLENFGMKRWGHNFIMDDLKMLLNTDDLFALKFDGPDGVELIKKIKHEKMI